MTIIYVVIAVRA